MKLVFYELKKVLCKRVFILVLILTLAGNACVFYYIQSAKTNNYPLTSKAEYLEMLEKYSAQSVDKTEKEISDSLLAFEIADNMNSLACATDNEEAEMYFNILKNYKKQSPKAYKKAEKLNKIGTVNLYDSMFLQDILSQCEYIKSYPEFISGMYDRAKAQSNAGVFSDKNSFSYKNLFKTARDYEHLKSIELKIGNNNALNAIMDFNLSDYLIIAIIFLCCIYLFGYERETRLYNLVRSTQRGRVNTLFAKLSSLALITIFVTMAFSLCNFIMGTYLYGATDLSRNIQSIPDFRNCVFNINILELQLLSVVVKAVTLIAIAFVFALVFICISNSALMYIVSVAVVIVEYLLNTLIPSNGALNHLKYINLFYIINTRDYIGKYLNLNIFNTPISIYTLTAIAFFTLISASIIISSTVFAKRNQENKASLFPRLTEALHSNFSKTHNGIFRNELYKYLIQNKMIFVFLILIVLAGLTLSKSLSYPYKSQSDFAYKGYMERLSGELTADKEAYINEQIHYFSDLEENLNTISDSTDYSDSAKNIIINSIENTLNIQGEAFKSVQAQYERISNNENAVFVDEVLYSDFLCNPKREAVNFLLFAIILIISQPVIFTVEYKNSVIDLLRPNKKGKFHLAIKKLILILLSATLSAILIYLPYLIRFTMDFGTADFLSPLKSIADYSTSSLNLLEAYLLELAMYLLLGIAVSGIITAICVKVKSNLLSMIVSTIAVMLPCILLLPFENLRMSSILKLDTAMLTVLTTAILLLVTSLSAIYVCVKFTNYKRKKIHGAKNT